MAFQQTRSPSFLSDCLVAFRRYPSIIAFAGAATFVAATAIVNRRFAKKTQRDDPPRGGSSTLHRIAEAGHMIPQSATADLMAAITLH